MYLLSELWFAFLDCGYHVTHTSSKKSVQPSLDSLHRDDMQIFGSCVVNAIDNGSYQKIQGNPEFRVPEDPSRPRFDILNAGKGQKGQLTSNKNLTV